MEDEEEEKQTLGQQNYWTRVISLNQPRMPLNMKFDIKTDMDEVRKDILASNQQINPAWHPLFDPDDFHREHKPLKLELFKLDQPTLEAKAMEALLIRRMFMARGVDLDQKAVDRDEQAGRDRKSSLVKLHRNYTRKSRYEPKPPAFDACKPRNTGAKYATRHMSELSLEEKIAIVHAYLCEKELQVDIARKYSVKPALVSSLVCKAKRSKHFLKDLRSVRDEAEQRIQLVAHETS